MQEFPAFEETYQAYKGQFELLAGSVPNSNDAVGFWNQNGYSFPMVIDVDGGPKFGVQPIPHTFFLDAQGNIVDQQVGMMEKAEFEAMLKKIL